MTRTKYIVACIAVVAAASTALGFCWPFGARERTLQLHGTVETQEVRLSSRVGGRVKKVAVAEGTLVQPGQVLVVFDYPELEARRDQLAANLEAAEAARDKAYNGARPEEKAVARAQVKTAQARLDKLLAGTRPEEIEQARQELASAEARLDNAQRELDREKLIGSASSKAAYEMALATCQDWHGKVKAAQARLQLLLAGPRDEEIREARAELERVTADLDRIESGTRSEELREADARVGELRGKLREIDAQLQELVVVAPERAVVEVIAVRPGDVVGPNQPVVRVLRADDLWVKTFVSEVDLGKVHLNDTVTVTIDSHPGVRFQGTVVQIASVSEFTPRNVQSIDERRNQVFAVKVRVADPQGIFKSGMAADVYVTLR